MSGKLNRNKGSKRNTFLRQFRDEKNQELKELTATQFIDIWNHYDSDGINRRVNFFSIK